MSNSKKVSPSRRRARARKGDVATPAEVLQACVFVIGDKAKTRPANNLVGDSPNETIAKCADVIFALASFTGGGSGFKEMAFIHPAVLITVVAALKHAARETEQLWSAAKAIVESDRKAA